MAAQAFALHIGINEVDPSHYHNGWNGQLFACENDALLYRDLAVHSGFDQTELLFSRQCSRAAAATAAFVRQRLVALSGALTAGDLLLLTFSGHGGLVPNADYDNGEPEDQTWCLPDRQLLDDELWQLLRRFAAGVRILVISDSCHSGTVIRGDAQQEAVDMVEPGMRTRYAPRNISFETVRRNPQVYYGLQRLQLPPRDNTAATVLLMAACQDHQKAFESDAYGLYTKTLKQVLDESGGHLSYRQLHEAVCSRMPPHQSPALAGYGSDLETFAQQPFLG